MEYDWEASRSFANASCINFHITGNIFFCKRGQSRNTVKQINQSTPSPPAECCTAASGWPCWWRWGASWTATWSPRGRRASEGKTNQCKASHKIISTERRRHKPGKRLGSSALFWWWWSDWRLPCRWHTAWRQMKTVSTVMIFLIYSRPTKIQSSFSHQDQAPPLSLQGTDHAEHREQQAADLHHVHDGQRGAGQQLRRRTKRMMNSVWSR